MSGAGHEPAERRPLASRDLPVMQRAAGWLIAAGVSPNAISLASIVVAALACLSFAATARPGPVPQRALFLLACLFVQLRLLANLLDGMVAVGSGKASPIGELFNDVPDRIADPVILAGAGYAAGGLPVLGWLAAVLALFVAYLRILGSGLGVRGLFVGPMAKPHRMAAITVAGLWSACVPGHWPGGMDRGAAGAMGLMLGVISAGCVVTAARRLARIAAHLREVH